MMQLQNLAQLLNTLAYNVVKSTVKVVW